MPQKCSYAVKLLNLRGKWHDNETYRRHIKETYLGISSFIFRRQVLDETDTILREVVCSIDTSTDKDNRRETYQYQ